MPHSLNVCKNSLFWSYSLTCGFMGFLLAFFLWLGSFCVEFVCFHCVWIFLLCQFPQVLHSTVSYNYTLVGMLECEDCLFILFCEGLTTFVRAVWLTTVFDQLSLNLKKYIMLTLRTFMANSSLINQNLLLVYSIFC